MWLLLWFYMRLGRRIIGIAVETTHTRRKYRLLHNLYDDRGCLGFGVDHVNLHRLHVGEIFRCSLDPIHESIGLLGQPLGSTGGIHLAEGVLSTLAKGELLSQSGSLWYFCRQWHHSRIHVVGHVLSTRPPQQSARRAVCSRGGQSISLFPLERHCVGLGTMVDRTPGTPVDAATFAKTGTNSLGFADSLADSTLVRRRIYTVLLFGGCRVRLSSFRIPGDRSRNGVNYSTASYI